MSQVFTRDDVVVRKPIKKLWIPFLFRARGFVVSVGGRDYKITTVKVPFGAGADVRVAESVARLDSADLEKAIAALLDVLNTQQEVDAALDGPDTPVREEG
ncbi:hypothetical protein [Amycolatopsis magusensis]|uniref:hypothetical protein n=1 Tax=Amycolatopsis magusensis TaxID=882444 RepID=UPI00379C8C76